MLIETLGLFKQVLLIVKAKYPQKPTSQELALGFHRLLEVTLTTFLISLFHQLRDYQPFSLMGQNLGLKKILAGQNITANKITRCGSSRGGLEHLCHGKVPKLVKGY